MIRLTIWMNMPSFYQSDLFRALVASSEIDLEVIFAKDLTSDRLQIGWGQDLSGYSHRFLSKRNPIAGALRLAWSQRNRIHVVNGLWAERAFAAALVVLALAKSKYIIYSEAPERIKFQSKRPQPFGKKWLQAMFSKVVVPRIGGVLAISHFSAEFFKSVGVREEIIYPFGYFRSHSAQIDQSKASKEKQRVEVVYVGRLLPFKRLDLLVEVMSSLFKEHPNLFLTIIGDGELLSALRRQVEELGVTERVSFEGVLPPDRIPVRVARADVLVLPSRGEGWGVVVNEALSVGVPVILSDRCGAADLIQDGVNGYVFRNEDSSDLRDCLSDFLSRREDWERLRAEAAALGEKISTENMAPYLIKCLNHMTGSSGDRPIPPWIQLASQRINH